MRGVKLASSLLRTSAGGSTLEADGSIFSLSLLIGGSGVQTHISNSRSIASGPSKGPSSKSSSNDENQDKKNELGRWWQAFSEQSRPQAENPRRKSREGGGRNLFVPKGEKQPTGQEQQESSSKDTFSRWLLSSKDNEGSATEQERQEITSKQVGARWLASTRDKSSAEQELSDLSSIPWFGPSKDPTSASERERLEVSMQRLSLMSKLGDKSQTSDFMFLPPKDNLLRKYFHWENMASAEKRKVILTKVRREFQIHKTDCGSSQVQIAQLTTKIKYMTKHMEMHRKDLHSRRGLEAMVQQRRKVLKYLRRKDWDSYCDVITKLGLRDNVMEPQKR